MHPIQNKLSFPSQRLSFRHLVLLFVVAYSFSVVIRMIWVYQFQSDPSFLWNGELMINTNDGYAWAEGARDILNGTKGFEESPVNEPVSILTAWMYHIVPFSFDTLILYMPTIFGSLLIVPILLIGISLKRPYVGFTAAVFGGIVWSYYNRTMTGYFDTDLLVVVLPTMLTWSVIHVMYRRDWNLVWLPPVITVFAWIWHGGGGHIATGIVGMLFVYFVLFAREDKLLMTLISLILVSISFTAMSYPLYKLCLILLIAFIFIKRKNLDVKFFMLLLLSGIALYLVSGGWNNIVSILRNAYILRADATELSLNYYAVVNTVREAGHIPFEIFANRISGHTITFFLSCVGYVMMVVRYPVMILSLPMVVLGFFALQGGLRFTVFSVPFMALGLMYLFFFLGKFLSVYYRMGFLGIAFIGVLFPNITHIQAYKVPTVFSNQEVKILDQLATHVSSDDYIIAWWDYGYPLRYYTGGKTLIDGGKHSGEHNFPTSYVLSSKSQSAVANMGRLAAEYTQMMYDRKKSDQSVRQMMRDYGFSDPVSFLNALNSDTFSTPEATRDVYLYLPLRMMEIFPTVHLFSNLDLVTGKGYPRPLFYYSKNYHNTQTFLDIGNNIKIFHQGGLIEINNQKFPMNQFITTYYGPDGKMHKEAQTINPNSPISVIFMKSYGSFLVVEQSFFQSAFVQMFVLENYDKNLFEPIVLTPLAKVYKLKK